MCFLAGLSGPIDLLSDRSMPCLCTQLATQAGALNVPNWVDAGKVFANDHPEIPQGECLISSYLIYYYFSFDRNLRFRANT